MIKKNTTNEYTKDTHNKGKKVLEIDFLKALGIFITAIIGTAVSTAFGMLRIINTDHFLTASNAHRIEALEESRVSHTEFELTIDFIKDSLERIENKLGTNK